MRCRLMKKMKVEKKTSTTDKAFAASQIGGDVGSVNIHPSGLIVLMPTKKWVI